MATPKKAKQAKKKKKKIVLTPEQKKSKAAEQKKKALERRFKTDINTIFKNAGFTQIPSRDKEFTFKGEKSELDNVYIFENIFVISEDTTATDSQSIADHLRKKSIFYKHVSKYSSDFIDFFGSEFPEFASYRKKHSQYDNIDYKILFMYCSKNTFESKHKKPHDHILFLDYPYLRYFLSLAKTIQKTTKYELFKFLNLEIKDIGPIKSYNSTIEVDGFLLPESPSGFPTDHNIVSFYIDPKTLLELSYVLRKDGNWRDTDGLYQRLIIKGKIKGMREYLSNEKRVFINNIIATLPESTKLLNPNGDTINYKKIDKTKATPARIKIPNEFNSIGIIDGQHRIFAYHEGNDKFEQAIASKRNKQNLLVTGIIYPDGTTQEKKLGFESKLFLEINDKQSRVKADLKQEIEMLVNPFESIAISKAVISKLAQSGPLVNLLEVHFFDTGKIKTSSVVSYGLKHIVKLNGEDSLFSIWNNDSKNDLVDKKNKELLREYIDFCAEELIKIFSGYKRVLSQRGLFTLDKKESRALSSTAINGVIFCLRTIIETRRRTGSHDFYFNAFQKLKIDYRPNHFKYKSSHWKDLGEELYKQCFV